jgi:hypothetical protein
MKKSNLNAMLKTATTRNEIFEPNSLRKAGSGKKAVETDFSGLLLSNVRPAT